MKSSLLLRALACEETERPPVWFMRQAGRFLPQYRALRKKNSLSSLFHTPELAAEVTLMPRALLGVDAAILFSDILVIAEALSYQVHFPDAGGILVQAPKELVEIPVEKALSYVFRTIELVKPSLDVPLIGFCGGPYTVGTYLKDTTPAMLQRLTDLSIDYLKLQIAAGVDAVQIFDSWAGHLAPEEFFALSLPYLKQMVDALRPSGIPVILFCRGSCRYASELAALKPAAISFDWEEEMAVLREKVPSGIAVQGNLDPSVFQGSLAGLEEKLKSLLFAMKGKPGYIFNLGHGVLPSTPVENAAYVVQRVKEEAKNLSRCAT